MTFLAYRTIGQRFTGDRDRVRCDGNSFAVDSAGMIIVKADAPPRLVFATFDLISIRKARRDERFR
jgi:hypothetical protein